MLPSKTTQLSLNYAWRGRPTAFLGSTPFVARTLNYAWRARPTAALYSEVQTRLYYDMIGQSNVA